MMSATEEGIKNPTLRALEDMVAQSCFCKLRTHCPDKKAANCLKDRNLYAEAMLTHKK
jgi:hypothetical protein